MTESFDLDAVFLTNTASKELYDMTVVAIKTLLQSAPNANVIVVESNPNHPFGSYPGLTLEPRKPFNYNEFMNIGIRYGKSSYVLMCNNDIIFKQNAVPALIDGLRRHNLESASPWEPSFHKDRHDGLQEVYFGHRIEYYVCGWCILATRAMLERLQPLDEQFEFWAQDLDYAKTLEVNGVRHGLIRAAEVQHWFSSSHNLLKNREAMTHGQVKKFEEKWATRSAGLPVTVVKPKVYDCFTFCEEFNLLDLRMAELKDVVDVHILVEAAVTHRGSPKPLNFYDKRFEYLDRVLPTFLDSLQGSTPTERAECQRNAILTALREAGAKSNDLILISDVDEIPDSSVIARFGTNRAANLNQEMFFFNARYRSNEQWRRAKILLFEELEHLGSVQRARDTIFNSSIDPGGWHMRYCADARSSFLTHNQVIKILDSASIEDTAGKSNRYLPREIERLGNLV